MKEFKFGVKDMLEKLNRIKLNKGKGQVLTIYGDSLTLSTHGKDGLNTITNYSDIEYKEREKGDYTSFDFWEFYDAIKDLSTINDEEACFIKVENNNASLKVDYMSIEIDTIDFEYNDLDYLPDPREHDHFYLLIDDNKQINNLIKDLETLKKFTINDDYQIPILTGVKVEIKDHNCRLIAVDGFKIATIDYPAKQCKDFNVDFDFVLSKTQLTNLIKVLRNNKNDCKEIDFTINKDGVVKIKVVLKDNFVSNKGVEILGNKLEGNYFDYTSVIPKTKTHSITLNKSNLVKTTKIIDKTKNHIVFEKIDNDLNIYDTDNKVKSKFTNNDLGNYNNVKFGLTPKYLLNSLDNINSDEVTLNFKAEGNTLIEPLVINDKNDYSNNNYYILPVRLR